VASSLNASEPDNFVQCEGSTSCDVSLLSDEQLRAVEAFTLGRNFLACAEGNSQCQLLKLTPKQAATLAKMREERKAALLVPILASARNFSACAYGEPSCDPIKLTAVQLATLRRLIAEQSLSAPSPLSPAQGPISNASERRRDGFKRFGLGLLNVLGAVAKAYVEIESEKAAVQPIVVSGGGTVIIPSSSTFVASTQTPFESRIDGNFEGWTGETIFKLTNGQIWQQSSYTYHYHYAYGPKVVIYRMGGNYRMQVEGVNATIPVVRLR
jgi:hypothetical protein